MENKIRSIEKGWGESSIFFTTNKNATETHRVDEIKEEGKQVSSDLFITVLRGYKDNKIFFEMGMCNEVTISYE